MANWRKIKFKDRASSKWNVAKFHIAGWYYFLSDWFRRVGSGIAYFYKDMRYEFAKARHNKKNNDKT